MTMIETALWAGATSFDPELIRWAYTHPQAGDDIKESCVGLTNCPADVLDMGYRHRLARVRKIAFRNSGGSTWAERLQVERSVEVLREVVAAGDPTTDQILMDNPHPAVATAVGDKLNDCPLAVLCKLPRNFWKYATDSHLSKVALNHWIAVVADPDVCDERFGRIVHAALPDLLSPLGPTAAQYVLDFLSACSERLQQGGVDVDAYRRMCQPIVDLTTEEGRDAAAAKAVAEHPELVTYHGGINRHSMQTVNGVKLSDIIDYLLRHGDYVSAGNLVVQISDYYYHCVDVTYAADLLNTWARWALRNSVTTDALDRMISACRPSSYGNEEHLDQYQRVLVALSREFGARVSALVHHNDALVISERLGSDCALSMLMNVPTGQLVVAEVLKDQPAAVTAAMDSLQPTWKGSLTELVAAARSVAA